MPENKIRIFVSSVQKELENERLAVTELIASEPFLDRHVDIVLFEQLPASADSPQQAYLKALSNCKIYLGIIGFEYGRKGPDGLSAAEREYREALRQNIPTYFFVKGDNSQDERRDEAIRSLVSEISDEQSGHVYKRFTHYQSLKSVVREMLVAELEKIGIRPTPEENEAAVQTMAQSSDFDSRLVKGANEEDLDKILCRRLASSSTGVTEDTIEPDDIRKILLKRGMIWHDIESGFFHPTAAGLLLLGQNPEEFFPQVRIAANAYGGVERGEPIDRLDIRDALPLAIEKSFQFLKRNMRHTTRIQGFSKVEIHEYSYEALREAVVNAVAHRDYDLRGSCIRIEKYADRIEVISPGLPPEPITLQKIKQLNYIACSRNPSLARGLSFFERIEEQGDGLRRIVRETEKIGLKRPQFSFRDGHFQLTFMAPKDMSKVKSQTLKPLIEISDSILETLNATQQNIVKIMLKKQQVRVLELADILDLSRPAIQKALGPMIEQGIVIKIGKGKDTSYELKKEMLP